jgi:hypothetical protein
VQWQRDDETTNRREQRRTKNDYLCLPCINREDRATEADGPSVDPTGRAVFFN